MKTKLKQLVELQEEYYDVVNKDDQLKLVTTDEESELTKGAYRIHCYWEANKVLRREVPGIVSSMILSGRVNNKMIEVDLR